MKRLQDVGLFGTKTRTDVLVLVAMLGETHASEIAKITGLSLSQVQRSLAALERVGVVVGVYEGKARRIRLCSAFFAKEELEQLLREMARKDANLQKAAATIRRRPRKSGKPL